MENRIYKLNVDGAIFHIIAKDIKGIFETLSKNYLVEEGFNQFQCTDVTESESVKTLKIYNEDDGTTKTPLEYLQEGELGLISSSEI